MNMTWFSCHPNNFERGRKSAPINMIVLHWMNGTLEETDLLFANPEKFVSAQYGVGDTDVHQYVREEDTAFHAGTVVDNAHSIGITIEGSRNLPISDHSYQTLAYLLEEVCRRNSIPIDREHIKGHNEIKINPTDGSCPGTLDVDRVVKDAKELSPATVVSKLRKQGQETMDTLQAIVGKLNVPLNQNNKPETQALAISAIETLQKKLEIVTTELGSKKTESIVLNEALIELNRKLGGIARIIARESERDESIAIQLSEKEKQLTRAKREFDSIGEALGIVPYDYLAVVEKLLASKKKPSVFSRGRGYIKTKYENIFTKRS